MRKIKYLFLLTFISLFTLSCSQNYKSSAFVESEFQKNSKGVVVLNVNVTPHGGKTEKPFYHIVKVDKNHFDLSKRTAYTHDKPLRIYGINFGKSVSTKDVLMLEPGIYCIQHVRWNEPFNEGFFGDKGHYEYKLANKCGFSDGKVAVAAFKIDKGEVLYIGDIFVHSKGISPQGTYQEPDISIEDDFEGAKKRVNEILPHLAEKLEKGVVAPPGTELKDLAEVLYSDTLSNW